MKAIGAAPEAGQAVPLPIDLNEIIDANECAKWLGINKRVLLDKVSAGLIPKLHLPLSRPRFHRATVLQALLTDPKD